MKSMRNVIMIHILKQQGLSISEIARQIGCSRTTVRKYLRQDPQQWSPDKLKRKPKAQCLITPYESYLKDRVSCHPGLSAQRLLREIKERGYPGGYTAVTDYLRSVRPQAHATFERRFETPAGYQAQAGFSTFTVKYNNNEGTSKRLMLFTEGEITYC